MKPITKSNKKTLAITTIGYYDIQNSKFYKTLIKFKLAMQKIKIKRALLLKKLQVKAFFLTCEYNFRLVKLQATRGYNFQKNCIILSLKKAIRKIDNALLSKNIIFNLKRALA